MLNPAGGFLKKIFGRPKADKPYKNPAEMMRARRSEKASQKPSILSGMRKRMTSPGMKTGPRFNPESKASPQGSRMRMRSRVMGKEY